MEIVLLDFGHLLFVGRHAFQPGQWDNHRQQKMQFGVFHHVGLNEQSRSVRIKTGRKPIDGIIDNHFANALSGIVVSRQRMPVDDTVEALVLILQTHPIVEGPDKVAQVQLPCRPHTAQDSRFLHRLKGSGRRLQN